MSYNPNIDYAAEIAKEMAKDEVDWGKISQLYQAREEKIKETGIQTQSTSDYIDKLWAERNQTNSPTLPVGQKAVAIEAPDEIKQAARDYYNKGLTSTYQPNERGIYTDTSGNVMGVLHGQDQSYYDNLMNNALPGDELSMVRAASSTATTADVFDPQQYIEELKAAQIRQQIAALDKAKSNSLSALADEEAGIGPMYYDARNRVGAQKDVGDLNFAQYMASRGIQGSAGGANQMYSNAAFQGQIGALDRQEQAARDRIARNRTGIENAYQSDVAAARAGAEAQALQAAIDQMNADRMFDLQKAGVTGEYQGKLTPAGQQSQAEQLQRQASLLAAQYYDDIQAYINTLDPNDPLVPYLYAERRKKIQAEAEKAAAAAAAQSEAEQQAWNNAFKLFQEVGRITSPEQAQILGLPQNATVADVDIARINAATSRMNAQTARMNAQTAATNANKTNEPSASDIYNNAVKNIDSSMYVYKDADGKIVVSNPQGLRNYIISLNLPDELTDSLLLRYGLPINQ
jgi:hypothetical protein